MKASPLPPLMVLFSVFSLSRGVEWINACRRAFLFCEDKTAQRRGIKERREESGDGGGAAAAFAACPRHLATCVRRGDLCGSEFRLLSPLPSGLVSLNTAP